MKIDHIGIAVRSLDEALAFYSHALGLACVGRDIVPEQGVRVAFLAVGDCRLELLEPTSEDSPVGRFLSRRGEGIHHLCLAVENIEAALDDLRARNIRLVDETPRCGAEGRKIAFLHPSTSHGVLIELVEALPESRSHRPERSPFCETAADSEGSR